MARAVRVPEAVDGCREDFDLPGRRGERVAIRVGAEISERHLRLAGHRQFKAVACPELVKTRHDLAAVSQVATHSSYRQRNQSIAVRPAVKSLPAPSCLR